MIEQKFDSWVMNVVPVSGPNTLPVIYDRGLIGVMHDWYVANFFFKIYKKQVSECVMYGPHYFCIGM